MSFNLDWFLAGGILTFKNIAQETYEIAERAGTRETISYNVGDYIMTDSVGHTYIISLEIFLKRNDDQGYGISIPKKLLNMAKIVDSNGTLSTAYGEKNYTSGNHYIIIHDANDYSVLDKDLFLQTYNTTALEQK